MVNQDELYSYVMTRSIVISCRLCEDVHGGSSSTHIPDLRMHEGWSCIQKKARLKFSTEISAPFKQISASADDMTHPFGETALIANLQFMTTFSLRIHRMRVKAKISVRGVRQMNCNEIPDIWQMAVRRFSRVQSMPSCLYKLYWAHWTKGVNVTSLTWQIEAAFSHTFGRYSAFK